MKANRDSKSFLVVLLGVVFEHFDMMLVSLLASSIIQEFVGTAGSVQKQLFYAYMGYAIAFVFRPVGAFAFGIRLPIGEEIHTDIESNQRIAQPGCPESAGCQPGG